jgi:small subunit ribosomal protein S5
VGENRRENRTENRSDSVEHTLQIRRCACVVKGGRRFSFAGLVVVGDGRGSVGWGYGKGPEVPIAVEKATRAAERTRIRVQVVQQTVAHRVEGRFGASRVVLIPASPGTGVIAGGTVRSIMNAVGVTDVLTKSYGSNCPLTLVKAVFQALKSLRTREQVARLRGIQL